MSWFDRIFKRGPSSQEATATVPGPLRPEQWTVPGITFDTSGWQLGEAHASRMSWKAPAGTLTLTREDLPAATPYPSLTDLRNDERAQARAREEDIVQVDVVSIRSVEVLRVICKSRRGSGSVYRLRVEVHGRETCIRIESDIDEGNFTGTREAMVNATRVQAGERVIGPPNPDGSHSIQGFFVDAYDPAFDGGALNSITDDERLDVLLPAHPLSRIRALQETITDSLRISPDISPVRILATSPRSEETRPPRRELSFVVLRHLYGAAERFDLVEAVLQEELAQLGDTPSLDLATVLMQLGIFLHMRDRPGNALPLLSKAERMFLDLTGSDGPGTATARVHHGCALMKLGRRAQSLPLFEQAIPVLEKNRKDDGTYMLALANAAGLLAERGDEQRATEYLSRAALDEPDPLDMSGP